MAALLALLGLSLCLRWFAGADWVARLVPGAAQSGIVNPLLFIGMALCFFEASLARPPAWLHVAATAAIVALLLLPAGYLVESIADVSLGIDIAPGNPPTPLNPHPGRFSPNASVAFLCCGLAFWQLRRAWTPWRGAVLLTALLLVAVIGAAGLVGYLLGLEQLYRFASFNRMLPGTAFGFAVAAVGLWLFHERYGPRGRRDGDELGRHIGRRTLAMLTLAAVGGGICGFALLRTSFENSVSQSLLLTASTNAAALANTIETSLWYPKLVATRPTVRQTVAALARDPGDAKARAQLQNIADSFTSARLSAARFIDAQGRPLASTGRFAEDVRVVHPLQGEGQDGQLLWDEGYLLRASHAVLGDDGSVVGRVVTEQRLVLFDRLLADLRVSGETLDAAVCSRDGDKAVCAPNKFRAQPFSVTLDVPPGSALATLVKGLRGERGVEFARDQRGTQVLAAYLPIAPYGLAFGVKSDVDALYAPLRSQVQWLALALAALVWLGVVAQRSQVRPVIEQLVASEQRQKVILEEQSELVSLSKPGGELTWVNPAYARHFGRTVEQIVGTSLYDHVAPADRELVRQRLEAVIAAGRESRSENRMAAPDGGECWVAWSNSVHRDPSGQTLLRSVGRDITLRRRAEQALAANERFLRQLTDNLPVRIAYIDTEGRYRFVNLAHCHRFGLPREQIVGRTRSELTGGATDALVQPHFEAVLRGEAQRFEFDEEVDGQRRRIESQLLPDIDEQGRVQGFYTTGVDITSQVQNRELLLRQTATLQSVIEAIPAVVAVVDRDLRYRFVNTAFEHWAGRPRDAIVGRTIAEILGADDLARIEPWARRALGGETVQFERTYPQRATGRHLRLTYVPMWNERVIDGFVGVAQDITEHREEAVRLLDLAQRDPLTGLLNRAGLEQFLQRRFAEPAGQSLALLVVDLDRFKPVNDAHGHAAGDEVLRQFAQRVQAIIRPTDAAARLGGDEFAVALTGVRELVHAERVADKILDAAQAPFTVGALTLYIGASIGVAVRDGDDWETLAQRADEKLYEAKRGGRGQRAG